MGQVLTTATLINTLNVQLRVIYVPPDEFKPGTITGIGIRVYLFYLASPIFIMEQLILGCAFCRKNEELVLWKISPENTTFISAEIGWKWPIINSFLRCCLKTKDIVNINSSVSKAMGILYCSRQNRIVEHNQRFLLWYKWQQQCTMIHVATHTFRVAESNSLLDVLLWDFD